MRKLVITISIMLPVFLLSMTPRNVAVASTSGTQKTTPKTSRSIINPAILSQTQPVSAFCPTIDPKQTLVTTKFVGKLQKPILVEKKSEIVPEVAGVAEEMPLLDKPTPASEAAVPVESVGTPTPPADASALLNAENIFSRVNTIRTDSGLPPFEKHADVCAVVQSRAPELDNEIYGSSYMHAGFKARQLPFRATENMISQQTEEAAVNWWMNSSVHRSALLGSYKYACVACHGRSCAMIFSNLDTF